MILHVSAGNALTGTIPASIGTMPNLRDLLISGNQFSGTLPSAILQMPKAARIDLVSLRNTQILV